MQIKDQGIILASRKVGEKNKVIRCFLHHHGLIPGLAPADSDPLVVRAIHSKRRENNLGFYEFEETSHGFSLLSPAAAIMLASALAVLDRSLPLGQPEPELWELLMAFIEAVGSGSEGEGSARSLTGMRQALECYLVMEEAIIGFQGQGGDDEHERRPGWQWQKELSELGGGATAAMLVRRVLADNARLLSQHCFISGRLPVPRLLLPKVVDLVYGRQANVTQNGVVEKVVARDW